MCGRSGQGQVSLVSLVTQSGRWVHGTIQSTNKHQGAGYIARNGIWPRYRGQGLGGLSAPILLLPVRRDAREERPYTLYEHHRALPEHGCMLGPPVTLRG